MSSNVSPHISISRRGLMLVLSSPSGAGKTTISRRLLEMDTNLHLSISVTTRPRRPGETDGVHYHFISNEDFGLMVNRQELLEHAKVFDYYYGTPREQVESRLASGQDILFDIDWQGTQQLAQNARADLVSVFILPPSIRDLERRLKTRAQDSAEVVAKRMSKAADEISHWAEYDYIVINDDVERCLAQVHAILTAERLRRHRGTGLVDFVKQLRDGR
ncbi:guanylate kinase [uncultured Ferrovibrio sp.]|jgi:guanylate kinase|uniref:guanylate kinase n=1 Tax=uncultured Ferrovibrio sp. TaxID=1576913 RepID=UPI0026257A2D|nr:guanylate kinase [uncultured Ferrovibrio sp.]